MIKVRLATTLFLIFFPFLILSLNCNVNTDHEMSNLADSNDQQTLNNSISRNISDGLVAHWQFENNLEDSVGSNHGNETGNISYVTGRIGTALYIDGNGQSINFGNHDSLQGIDSDYQWSIAYWINIREIITSSQIFIKGDWYHSFFGDYNELFFRKSSGACGVIPELQMESH